MFRLDDDTDCWNGDSYVDLDSKLDAGINWEFWRGAGGV